MNVSPEEVGELSKALSDLGVLARQHERAACAGYELIRLVRSGFCTITLRTRAPTTEEETFAYSKNSEVEAVDVRGRVEVSTSDDIFEALALCGKKLRCNTCKKDRPADWFWGSDDRLRCRECSRTRAADYRKARK